jgi:hypothetical protein
LALQRQHWTDGLLDRLADDLANADTAVTDGAALHLEGLLERDPASGLLTDRRGTCTYRIVHQSRRRLWLREQNGYRRLLGAGADDLVIEALLRDGQTAELARLSGTVKTGEPSEPVELPPRLAITLLDAENQPLATRPVIRRPLADGDLTLQKQAP